MPESMTLQQAEGKRVEMIKMAGGGANNMQHKAVQIKSALACSQPMLVWSAKSFPQMRNQVVSTINFLYTISLLQDTTTNRMFLSISS